MTPDPFNSFPVMRGGLQYATVNIEVVAENESRLLHALFNEMTEREIEADKAVGAFGWRLSHPDSDQKMFVGGISWDHDPRLHPWMAVIWRPDIIVPPATVLDPRGIIYGAVKK
jgi:hypothetical protein